MATRRVGLLAVHTSPLAQPGTGDGGGLNVYVLEVARGLARRGVEVDIFTRASSPKAPASITVTPGVKVHHVVAGPARPLPKSELPQHLPAFALGVLGHPSTSRLDVLHAHYWMSGWVARRVGERTGTPVVQTFHTLGVVKNAALATGEAPEPAGRLRAETLLAQRTDHLVALTCGEARLLHQHFGTSGARITVVPAGVDTARFHPQPHPARTRPTPAGGPLILFVGRLQPVKGPDVAVATLAELRRLHPTARLLVVGGVSGNGAGRSGPAELFAAARELAVDAAVEVIPARPQTALADLYRRADVVHVPSRSESFGLVALEAQASGTPVVAADVGGLSTLVRRGGTKVTGHDPVAHAGAIARYLGDPDLARRTGEAGRDMAERYTWDRTVEGLLATYDRLGVSLRRAG